MRLQWLHVPSGDALVALLIPAFIFTIYGGFLLAAALEQDYASTLLAPSCPWLALAVALACALSFSILLAGAGARTTSGSLPAADLWLLTGLLLPGLAGGLTVGAPVLGLTPARLYAGPYLSTAVGVYCFAGLPPPLLLPLSLAIIVPCAMQTARWGAGAADQALSALYVAAANFLGWCLYTRIWREAVALLVAELLPYQTTCAPLPELQVFELRAVMSQRARAAKSAGAGAATHPEDTAIVATEAAQFNAPEKVAPDEEAKECSRPASASLSRVCSSSGATAEGRLPETSAAAAVYTGDQQQQVPLECGSSAQGCSSGATPAPTETAAVASLEPVTPASPAAPRLARADSSAAGSRASTPRAAQGPASDGPAGVPAGAGEPHESAARNLPRQSWKHWQQEPQFQHHQPQGHEEQQRSREDQPQQYRQPPHLPMRIESTRPFGIRRRQNTTPCLLLHAKNQAIEAPEAELPDIRRPETAGDHPAPRHAPILRRQSLPRWSLPTLLQQHEQQKQQQLAVLLPAQPDSGGHAVQPYLTSGAASKSAAVAAAAAAAAAAAETVQRWRFGSLNSPSAASAAAAESAAVTAVARPRRGSMHQGGSSSRSSSAAQVIEYAGRELLYKAPTWSPQEKMLAIAALPRRAAPTSRAAAAAEATSAEAKIRRRSSVVALKQATKLLDALRARPLELRKKWARRHLTTHHHSQQEHREQQAQHHQVQSPVGAAKMAWALQRMRAATGSFSSLGRSSSQVSTSMHATATAAAASHTSPGLLRLGSSSRRGSRCSSTYLSTMSGPAVATVEPAALTAAPLSSSEALPAPATQPGGGCTVHERMQQRQLQWLRQRLAEDQIDDQFVAIIETCWERCWLLCQQADTHPASNTTAAALVAVSEDHAQPPLRHKKSNSQILASDALHIQLVPTEKRRQEDGHPQEEEPRDKQEQERQQHTQQEHEHIIRDLLTVRAIGALEAAARLQQWRKLQDHGNFELPQHVLQQILSDVATAALPSAAAHGTARKPRPTDAHQNPSALLGSRAPLHDHQHSHEALGEITASRDCWQESMRCAYTEKAAENPASGNRRQLAMAYILRKELLWREQHGPWPGPLTAASASAVAEAPSEKNLAKLQQPQTSKRAYSRRPMSTRRASQRAHSSASSSGGSSSNTCNSCERVVYEGGRTSRKRAGGETATVITPGAATTAAETFLARAAGRGIPPQMPLQDLTLKFADTTIEDLLLPAAALFWAINGASSSGTISQQHPNFLDTFKAYATGRIMLQFCGEVVIFLMLLSSRSGHSYSTWPHRSNPGAGDPWMRGFMSYLFHLRLCLCLADIPVHLLLLPLQQLAVEDLVLYGPLLLQLAAVAQQQQNRHPRQPLVIYVAYSTVYSLVIAGCALLVEMKVMNGPPSFSLLLLLLRSGAALSAMGSVIHLLVLGVEEKCSRSVFSTTVLPYLLRLEAATYCGFCRQVASPEDVDATAATDVGVTATGESSAPEEALKEVLKEAFTRNEAERETGLTTPEPLCDLGSQRQQQPEQLNTLKSMGQRANMEGYRGACKCQKKWHRKLESETVKATAAEDSDADVTEDGALSTAWSDIEPSRTCRELLRSLPEPQRTQALSDTGSKASISSDSSKFEFNGGPRVEITLDLTPTAEAFRHRAAGVLAESTTALNATCASLPCVSKESLYQGTDGTAATPSACATARAAAVPGATPRAARDRSSSKVARAARSSSTVGKQLLHILGTRLSSLSKSPKDWTKVLGESSPALEMPVAPAASAAATTGTVTGASSSLCTPPVSFVEQRPSSRLHSLQRGSSSNNNMPAWLRGDSHTGTPVAKGPPESRPMRSLMLLYRLSSWKHRSSSCSSSRLWGETGITSPNVARPIPSGSHAGGHTASRFFSFRARAAATSPGHSFSIPAPGGATTLSRAEEPNLYAESSRGAAPPAAKHCRYPDIAHSSCDSKWQQVATLQQQLQLQSSRSLFFSSFEQRNAVEVGYGRAASKGADAAGSAARAAATRLETTPVAPTAAATDVWIGFPPRSLDRHYLEQGDLQQQQQQPHVQQQQRQHRAWHPSPKDAAVPSDASPQLHRIFSMRRPDELSNFSYSTSNVWAAPDLGEPVAVRDLLSDVFATRGNSWNDPAQIPLPSTHPALLQQESFAQSAAAAAGGSRGGETPAVAGGEHPARAAAAAWSRGASARLRPAKQGAALAAQRAAAAALLAAAEEVGDGRQDTLQDGGVLYPSQCIRNRLEKLLWGLSI
ncbi:uncharacterized protein LOC34620822 [Cyclospora cayetanensis]|uniref:Uncharacterized protein LOC34620822 n=1 Tax=Cyclospora cayetanensis TaxID=88456 RepID=A0A6P6RVT3_9EIME|nr:uncharacterized protein LOC34620822 [Cyclospora cayetanensis]